MSHLGTLVQHFTESADLAQTLNAAIVDLKRVADMPASGVLETTGISFTEIQQQRARLANILEALLMHLDDTTASDMANVVIPVSVIAQIRNTQQQTLAYLREDIAETRDRLHTDVALTNIDFARLDMLLGMIDADSAAIFRRMVRR